MKFLSFVFVLFMALLILLLFMIKQEERRQSVLLTASYVFYAYADYRFPVFLFLQTLIAWFSARMIDSREKVGKKPGIALATGVAFSVGTLAVLKYAGAAASLIANGLGGGIPGYCITPRYIVLYFSGNKLYGGCLSEKAAC